MVIIKYRRGVAEPGTALVKIAILTKVFRKTMIRRRK